MERRVAGRWVAAVALLTAACGASVSGGASSTSTTGAPRGVASSVCARVPHCHVEQSADVDGDGVADAVAVVGRPRVDKYEGYWWPYHSRLVVRVETAKGLFSWTTRLDGVVFGHIVHGAATVDGLPGDELLLSAADGAHGQAQTILTLRGSRLVALPSPGTSAGSWGVDGSLMSNAGWRCLPGAEVEQFVAGGEGRAGQHVKYTLWHRTWRWTPSGWQALDPRDVAKHEPSGAVTDEYRTWTDCGTFVRYRRWKVA